MQNFHVSFSLCPQKRFIKYWEILQNPKALTGVRLRTSMFVFILGIAYSK
jgi:hypothetical protein